MFFKPDATEALYNCSCVMDDNNPALLLKLILMLLMVYGVALGHAQPPAEDNKLVRNHVELDVAIPDFIGWNSCKCSTIINNQTASWDCHWSWWLIIGTNVSGW